MSQGNIITPQQRIFALEYINNGHGAKAAALKAGYSESYSMIAAHKLLRRQSVKEFIEKQTRKVEEKLEISFEWKAKKLKRIIDEAVRDDDTVDMDSARIAINAIAELNKMYGDYAPARTETINVSVGIESDKIKQLMQSLDAEY